MGIIKFAATAVAVAGLFSSGLAAQRIDQIDPQYPHAYPREGVKQLFDNDRVTIWEVHWLKNVPQPIHRHLYDMAGVYLRYGFINVTTPEGKVNPSNMFEVPRPYYQPRAITHKEEAAGGPNDPERMAIMVDLKEELSGPEGVVMGLTAAFPREGAKIVLDNPRVRMSDFTWAPNKPIEMHVHAKDAVEVFVTGGTIKRTRPDDTAETVTYKAGDAHYIKQHTVDTEEAVNSSPRIITIELK